MFIKVFKYLFDLVTRKQFPYRVYAALTNKTTYRMSGAKLKGYEDGSNNIPAADDDELPDHLLHVDQWTKGKLRRTQELWREEQTKLLVPLTAAWAEVDAAAQKLYDLDSRERKVREDVETAKLGLKSKPRSRAGQVMSVILIFFVEVVITADVWAGTGFFPARAWSHLFAVIPAIIISVLAVGAGHALAEIIYAEGERGWRDKKFWLALAIILITLTLAALVTIAVMRVIYLETQETIGPYWMSLLLFVLQAGCVITGVGATLSQREPSIIKFQRKKKDYKRVKREKNAAEAARVAAEQAEKRATINYVARYRQMEGWNKQDETFLEAYVKMYRSENRLARADHKTPPCLKNFSLLAEYTADLALPSPSVNVDALEMTLGTHVGRAAGAARRDAGRAEGVYSDVR